MNHVTLSRLGSLLLGGTLALGMGPISTAGAEDLRIGFLAPTTGIFAQVGKDMVDGFQMYLDEVKSDFGNAKVKLIVEDEQGKPDTAVTKAKKLILQDKVHMFVGGSWGTKRNPQLGTITDATSPNDPIFWLLHANADRIWTRWQMENGRRNYRPEKGATFGHNAGYAINPARDFAPRLFTAMAGWGPGVFTAADYWWWVPIVGPLVGGVVGAYVYDLLITNHHPPAQAADEVALS